jgi:hypothetical protein
MSKKPETLRLMATIGVLLYYSQCINNTMLVTLSSLATAQAKGTEATAEACTQLLNYAATHPEATIRYKASDMILLHIHSNASYHSEPQARSRVGGFFFLLLNGQDPATPTLNGAIHVLVLSHFIASDPLGSCLTAGYLHTTRRPTYIPEYSINSNLLTK